MKSISREQILNLQHAKQHFCDCYLVSSLNCLSRTNNGRRILAQNILTGNNGFQISFNNLKGHKTDYFVTNNELDKLVLLDRFCNEVPIDEPYNPIVKAVEIAMNKLISKHRSAKSFFCRLATCQERFEYNMPSNFLEMFTGISPISLNESGFRRTMKSDKDKLFEILENIDKNNGGSFILGTSRSYKDLAAWHCFTITGVNAENQYVEFTENRKHRTDTMDFETIARAFKYIVGYYDEMLAKN